MSLSRFFFAPTFVNAWATAKPPLPTLLVAEARRQRGCEWVRSGKTGRRALTDANSADRPSRFIRVMILPRALLGKSSLQFVDPADAKKPRAQQYQILADAPIARPKG